MNQFITILPDILLLTLGILIFAVDLIRGTAYDKPSKMVFYISTLGLAGIFLLLYNLPAGTEFIWFGTYQINGFGILFKELFVLSALFTILLARSYFLYGGGGRTPIRWSSEFQAVVVLASFGMFVVVSSTDLITLFVGLELATVPLYFLTALNRKSRGSVEAASKYVIMGSVATAFLIFGFSYLYGVAGGVRFSQIAEAIALHPKSGLVWLGITLVLCGVGFKMTLFPFHMWAPDVYEGAPTPVTAFLSVSSKSTAVAILILLFHGPFAAVHADIQWMILLIAGLSMVVGNLGAMRQVSLRRFMGYSSIAQAGFILMALAGPEQMAHVSMIFYLFAYGAANYAVFFVIAVIGRNRKEEFSSLRGLSRQNPGLAAVLAMGLFSLAGIPPVAGFLGKFMLFASAASAGHYAFVVFAGLNSTLALYYYLLLMKEAYIIPPENDELSFLHVSTVQKLSLLVLGLAILLLGILPQGTERISHLLFTGF